MSCHVRRRSCVRPRNEVRPAPGATGRICVLDGAGRAARASLRLGLLLGQVEPLAFPLIGAGRPLLRTTSLLHLPLVLTPVPLLCRHVLSMGSLLLRQALRVPRRALDRMLDGGGVLAHRRSNDLLHELSSDVTEVRRLCHHHHNVVASRLRSDCVRDLHGHVLQRGPCGAQT